MADNTAHHQPGTASAHPIADKFTGHTDTTSAESGNYTGFGTGRVPLPSGLTGALDRDHAAGANNGLPLGNAVHLGTHQHGNHGHEHHQSHHAHHQGQPAGDAVSGAYAGGQTTNALTGESHAHTTGAGVGPLAENLHGSTGTGAGTAGLAAAGVGAAGAAGAGASGYGTGIGPAGGAGGHYASGPGNATSTSGATTSGLAGATGTAGATGATGATSAAAATGAGAAAGGSALKSADSSKQSDFVAGAPVADPKDLDTGGKHSLVFDEKTGKYVHRHDLQH